MRRVLLSFLITMILAACDSGDVNINPTTADNSNNNSNNTETAGGETNPCAAYQNEAGLTIQGAFDGTSCTYSPSFVDAYNVFGDRLYVAGRNGAPDGYEQPFHSLDFTYSWYPIDTLTLKFKVKNLLDESVVIERQGVTTFGAFPGLVAAIDLNWAL